MEESFIRANQVYRLIRYAVSPRKHSFSHHSRRGRFCPLGFLDDSTLHLLRGSNYEGAPFFPFNLHVPIVMVKLKAPLPPELKKLPLSLDQVSLRLQQSLGCGSGTEGLGLLPQDGGFRGGKRERLGEALKLPNREDESYMRHALKEALFDLRDKSF